jgi:hypothetical protein
LDEETNCFSSFSTPSRAASVGDFSLKKVNDFPAKKDGKRDDEVMMRLAIKMMESQDFSEIEYASVSYCFGLMFKLTSAYENIMAEKKVVDSELRKSEETRVQALEKFDKETSDIYVQLEQSIIVRDEV